MEKIRVRCPVCGSMPDLDQLEQTTKEKPAKIRIFIQKFGGKASGEAVPDIYKKKKRGSAPGYMEYIDVTDDSPEQLAQMKAWFDGRVAEYLAGDQQ